ncbi:MAG: 50S ribosomal protein L17 [Candidatus Bipolaricaulota bacterium]|nr:50S ribosomal protein L17 [Candidatus Bipolaricaulota bacterium]
MRHRRTVVKLGMDKSHRKSVLINITSGLIMNGKVDTTLARARAGQRYAERMISLARRGDQHARRLTFSKLGDKQAVNKLFSELGPRYADRPGGYTRVVKLGPRRGDGAERARLMLV